MNRPLKGNIISNACELLTNQVDAPAHELIDGYTRWVIVENTTENTINFFHMDSLSVAVPIKMDLELQITYCEIVISLGRRTNNPRLLTAGYMDSAESILWLRFY